MKRKEDEDFEAYKKRRKADQKHTKMMLKGRLIWDSPREGATTSEQLKTKSQEAWR